MSSSSRIMRAPTSRAPAGVEEPKQGAKGKLSGKGKAIPKEAKGGFESHSGRDVLLGEKAKMTPSLIRKAPTQKGAAQEGKGKPTKEGKATKAGEAKDSSRAKGTADKGKELAQVKAEVSKATSNKKGGFTTQRVKESQTKATQAQAKGRATQAKAVATKGTSQQPAASSGSTQMPLGQGKTASQAAAQQPVGGAMGDSGAPPATGGTASSQGVGTGAASGVGDLQPGATAAKSKAGVAAPGTSATPGVGTTNAKQDQVATQGSLQRSLSQETIGTQGMRGAAGAYAKGASAVSSGLVATSHSSLAVGHDSSSAQALSLRTLHFQEGKDIAKAQENAVDSPRQQLRAMIKQWATLSEWTILQQGRGVTIPDAAAIAQKLSSLAQSGQIPMADLMSTLLKLLKRPGNRKKLQKIKEMLIKKGVISAGISTETLELIAAMIALYLAKSGVNSAEELIVELFNTPSQALELPDEGGSHHQEGREQQRHEEHQHGKFLSQSGED